jgi:putative restriction endonuclease
MNNSLLQKYLTKFQNLRQGITQYGKAPHKPILLISIIEEIENRNISENKIYITPELVALFKENWTLLVDKPFKVDFALPFYHLSGDNFWKLKTKNGSNLLNYIKSFYIFNETVDFAYLEIELFEILKEKNNRQIFISILLDKYFPETKKNYIENKDKGNSYLKNIEDIILESKKNDHIIDVQIDEEESFIRGGLFKKLVHQVYNFTCCISGMKLISTYGISMIDACHIKPISYKGIDHISNGIALCPNFHRAFDRGLLTIDSNYRIIISSSFAEDENNDYSIRRYKDKSIKLPFGEQHYPNSDFLTWHEKNIFKQ